jgi:hypothetical protein
MPGNRQEHGGLHTCNVITIYDSAVSWTHPKGGGCSYARFPWLLLAKAALRPIKRNRVTASKVATTRKSNSLTFSEVISGYELIHDVSWAY